MALAFSYFVWGSDVLCSYKHSSRRLDTRSKEGRMLDRLMMLRWVLPPPFHNVHIEPAPGVSRNDFLEPGNGIEQIPHELREAAKKTVSFGSIDQNL